MSGPQASGLAAEEIVAHVVAALIGSVARFCGTPFERCPLDGRDAAWWRYGWLFGGQWLDMYGQAEAARWLDEGGSS